MSLVSHTADMSANKGASGKENRISDMVEVEGFTDDDLKEKRILTRSKSKKHLLNLFRSLRTTLHKHSGDNNYVCVITSVLSGGGSSYIANNLAAAIALDELKSALMIDCNIYAPSAHNLLTTDYKLGEV